MFTSAVESQLSIVGLQVHVSVYHWSPKFHIGERPFPYSLVWASAAFVQKPLRSMCRKLFRDDLIVPRTWSCMNTWEFFYVSVTMLVDAANTESNFPGRTWPRSKVCWRRLKIRRKKSRKPRWGHAMWNWLSRIVLGACPLVGFISHTWWHGRHRWTNGLKCVFHSF